VVSRDFAQPTHAVANAGAPAWEGWATSIEGRKIAAFPENHEQRDGRQLTKAAGRRTPTRRGPNDSWPPT
jgi:hypothetical protein